MRYWITTGTNEIVFIHGAGDDSGRLLVRIGEVRRDGWLVAPGEPPRLARRSKKRRHR